MFLGESLWTWSPNERLSPHNSPSELKPGQKMHCRFFCQKVWRCPRHRKMDVEDGSCWVEFRVKSRKCELQLGLKVNRFGQTLGEVQQIGICKRCAIKATTLTSMSHFAMRCFSSHPWPKEPVVWSKLNLMAGSATFSLSSMFRNDWWVICFFPVFQPVAVECNLFTYDVPTSKSRLSKQTKRSSLSHGQEDSMEKVGPWIQAVTSEIWTMDTVKYINSYCAWETRSWKSNFWALLWHESGLDCMTVL